MIKRELYMKRIRPFIGSDLIKVMTGIRRCGKSVMLELIKEELIESGVNPTQFISINFEDLSFSHLQTAQSLHDEITSRAKEIGGKVYLFFDEIQEVKDWEKCINSFRVLPSGFPHTLDKLRFVVLHIPAHALNCGEYRGFDFLCGNVVHRTVTGKMTIA